ncbi:MAG: hypothetical protein V4438_02035 [Patescibacteria group bacterium]
MQKADNPIWYGRLISIDDRIAFIEVDFGGEKYHGSVSPKHFTDAGITEPNSLFEAKMVSDDSGQQMIAFSTRKEIIISKEEVDRIAKEVQADFANCIPR